MAGRAVLLRCPRCGSGGQFRHWIRRADHCPGCGYTLDRESDSFFGAYLLSLVVTFAAIFGLLIAMVIFQAAERPLPIGPTIGVGIFFTIGLPVLFYPFSFTLWTVVDLHNDPIKLAEIASAAERIRDGGLHADEEAGAPAR